MDWKTYDKRCTHAIEIRTALGDAPLLPPAGGYTAEYAADEIKLASL